ncbi:MAG: outer membrane lipoprotein-sorting protein [Deltaproteobacteria bacterium]
MKKPWIFVFVICVGLFFGGAAARAEMTADEIVAKADHIAYYQGRDGSARVSMAITDAQGRTRDREFSILRMNEAAGDGAQKYYVYFHKPFDIRGMAYLVWKHPDRDDDRWLYLPALDLVRRIAASDKRSSFAGTTFLYEDVSGRSVDLDTHELEAAEADAYVVKNTPKDPGSVEFAYYVTKIRKADFVPVEAEYFDREGKLYRRITALKTSEIQGYITVTSMKAEDLNAGTVTVSAFSDIKYDVGLTDDVFTERYLRRPPLQWIGE